ncbi:T-cell immunomodulatory protein [Osmia bicornis bicornis]|uniref:T-cell immunomodulatory protein n=1 Tax=Osmia bicornis bicornis TaxID=1437191 RepID=UPI001EAF28FD|nr:T-cell immunomodulatory protein [Osmia bicornis bicornis]XP_029042745.2 T-cell immunomodulatory protein [Osmia bicornis bicornis]XP_029042746.2 T-cell immunomodulatory protein [Osmia bicornis bicornis]XP_029042747.2 T-cell immunomodulatory protein [Osmia bicornis bicornis]
MRIPLILVHVVTVLITVRCSDITPAVFGNVLDGMPAAFGDFNSDELTDVFMLRKNGTTVQIFLAAEQEPLLRPSSDLSCTFRSMVVSVVPGDFDGDVFMDVLVITFDKESKLSFAYILWGGNGRLNCTNEGQPLIKMIGQPLALDFNGDMIIDLFGVNENGSRTFWVFDQSRRPPMAIPMDELTERPPPISQPHSNAYLDLNNDFLADLVVSTSKCFEIWLGIEQGFRFHETIPFPYNISLPHFEGKLGQALYLDVELTGKMDLLLPLCFDEECTNSTIMMYSDKWYNLQVNFRDGNSALWGFVKPDGHRYTDTITLRGGDFNMDGYPDLLATLKSTVSKQKRSYLLENVACYSCVGFTRKFQVKWQALNPFHNETAMAVFYDFYQDGILDVILVEAGKSNNTYSTAAFKNSLDYDANFVKVMVLTGRTNSLYPISPGSLGKKKRTYGTNLPGPSIAYRTTTQDGSPRSAIAAQLPQSAHFSLNLPYTTFGLGRTPNFVDALTIGVGGKSREWPQIIPNSQMVVIPNPIAEPWRWKAQLFVTPSKLILLSAAALTGTCGLISLIIVALYWKERREDKIEKLQEAHRFHFDAM